MTLEHSSVAYFPSYFSSLSMVPIFVLKYQIILFSNIISKSILIEIYFIKEKAMYLEHKYGRRITY